MVFKRKGSECSPKPYKFGFSGNEVLSLRYCDSKIRLAAEVSKSTSPVLARTIEKENGEEMYLNLSLPVAELDFPPGRGRTEAGT